jgi:pantoate kinase
MTTPPPIAEQLRAALAKKLATGATMQSVAKEADIAYSMVFNFHKNPAKKLQLETAEALARALGLQLKVVRI